MKRKKKRGSFEEDMNGGTEYDLVWGIKRDESRDYEEKLTKKKWNSIVPAKILEKSERKRDLVYGFMRRQASVPRWTTTILSLSILFLFIHLLCLISRIMVFLYDEITLLSPWGYASSIEGFLLVGIRVIWSICSKLNMGAKATLGRDGRHACLGREWWSPQDWSHC